MTRLILHLGGGWRDRADKCVELLNRYPDAQLLISSEGGKVEEYYRSQGVSDFLHDKAAWDTLTNFTHTLHLVKNVYRADKVLIVTHEFHMERAMKIAQAVYFGTGITPVACPTGIGLKKKNEANHVLPDTIRAWVWRLTGLLFYWKSVRRKRKQDYRNGVPGNWKEIGL